MAASKIMRLEAEEALQETSSRQTQLNSHYENRIRELEAENSRLRDELAVDEIKLNLVMSCETQFMNPPVSETVTDLKNQLAEKDLQLGKLKKRLRSVERQTSSQSVRPESSEIIVELLEAHFQCAVCNELMVKTTGLSCGHTFCFDCVDKWRKKSETRSADPNNFGGTIIHRATCPICRMEITTQAPLKSIDAFLDKSVDIFGSDEVKKSRKTLIAEAATAAKQRITYSNSISARRLSLPSRGAAHAGPPGDAAATPSTSSGSSFSTRAGPTPYRFLRVPEFDPRATSPAYFV